MIEIRNTENHVRLKCDVIGYEFPDDLKDNWCLLKVEVKQGNQIFERVDPAVETTDLVELEKWFKCLSEKKLPKYARLTFTEPCIGFEFLSCTNDQVRISVALSNELKPTFMLEQFNSKHREWNIVFDLNEKGFAKIIAGIQAAINSYPIRR